MKLVNVIGNVPGDTPVVSLVHVPPTAGFPNVFQQTPHEVTVPTPGEVMVPPVMADVVVIPETAVVVSTGRTEPTSVLNVRSLP